MNEDEINRIKEIIWLAKELKWIQPPNKTAYSLMQLSEVEKCMVAMVNDFELDRMRKWAEEVKIAKQKKDAEG